MMLVFASLTTSDKIQLTIAAITGVAALAALAGLALSQANERRRSQPIVIAHEAVERHFARETNAMWSSRRTSRVRAAGPAFNVRFGVEFGGVRHPYRLSVDDPESGNVQRVLRPGDRRPSDSAWPILLTSLAIWGRAADSVAAGKAGSLDADCVYCGTKAPTGRRGKRATQAAGRRSSTSSESVFPACGISATHTDARRPPSTTSCGNVRPSRNCARSA